MKTLVTALAGLSLLGCGPDETAVAESQSQTSSLEGEVIETETPLRLEIVNTEQGLIFRLVQDPVEERFFVPPDVTQTPAPPVPPCPACR